MPVSLAFVVLAAAAPSAPPTKAYAREEGEWRKQMDADLRRPESWLSLAGLFWLKEGANSVGSGGDSAVKLPSPAPGRVGILELDGEKVRWRPREGAATVDGKPANGVVELVTDAQGMPSKVHVGDLVFVVIQRGARVGVRLWNPKSKNRTEFKGRQWFALDPSLRIKAKFVPYNPPKPIRITNVLGDVTDAASPGSVQFVYKGKKCRLDAEDAGGGLFLNFADATSGGLTYGAGRFLNTPKPEGGFVIVDFNRAYNPPCAFTAFATCPLPPKGNRLPVAIRAGEKFSGHHPG